MQYLHPHGSDRSFQARLPVTQEKALADRYAMSSDWDDNWRDGGGGDEMCESAGIEAESFTKGASHIFNNLNFNLHSKFPPKNPPLSDHQTAPAKKPFPA